MRRSSTSARPLPRPSSALGAVTKTTPTPAGTTRIAPSPLARPAEPSPGSPRSQALGVDADPRQERLERAHRERALDHVGVQRVGERVGLPVVPEEQLSCSGGTLGAPAKELPELEADVLPQVAKLSAAQELEL